MAFCLNNTVKELDSDKAEKNELRLEIKRIIATLESLPTLPRVATKVLELLTDCDPDIDDVIKLIEADQAITMRILKLVNSARFGMTSRISSIKKAVVLLGFAEVRCVLLSTTVAESIAKTLRKECAIEQDALWRHSLASAVCAEMLIGEAVPELKAEAFVGGLLHDVGKLVLELCFPEKFAQLKIQEAGYGSQRFQSEEDNFGVIEPASARGAVLSGAATGRRGGGDDCGVAGLVWQPSVRCSERRQCRSGRAQLLACPHKGRRARMGRPGALPHWLASRTVL